jgi:hypothetical protein
MFKMEQWIAFPLIQNELVSWVPNGIGREAMKCCPECESLEMHPSRRKGIVERTILAMIFVRPFRCERCDARFYRWAFSANPQAPRQATPLT